MFWLSRLPSIVIEFLKEWISEQEITKGEDNKESTGKRAHGFLIVILRKSPLFEITTTTTTATTRKVRSERTQYKQQSFPDPNDFFFNFLQFFSNIPQSIALFTIWKEKLSSNHDWTKRLLNRSTVSTYTIRDIALSTMCPIGFLDCGFRVVNRFYCGTQNKFEYSFFIISHFNYWKNRLSKWSNYIPWIRKQVPTLWQQWSGRKDHDLHLTNTLDIAKQKSKSFGINFADFMWPKWFCWISFNFRKIFRNWSRHSPFERKEAHSPRNKVFCWIRRNLPIWSASAGDL